MDDIEVEQATTLPKIYQSKVGGFVIGLKEMWGYATPPIPSTEMSV